MSGNYFCNSIAVGENNTLAWNLAREVVLHPCEKHCLVYLYGVSGVGKTQMLQAIEHGYNEARSAIFDANITNVIAGVLLFYFGSGPVRGFAVVLMIGIVTSVFTAVTLTRMWVAGWLRRSRPADIVL